MTIQFACDCGRQLAAADEHAGKRVRCTSCGGVQTVPKPRVAAPRVTEPSQLIRFDCDCGQTCQARPEHAGRNTKCPRCGTLLTIPRGGVPEELEEVPARRSALQAELPKARSIRRPAFDEDQDEDEDDRQSRRRKSVRRKSRRWIWISAAAALLLLLGGGLALFLMLGGISDDFDLVPRDAQGFVTVRVADTLNTPLGKKVMDRLDAPVLAQLKQFEQKIGLGLKDVERVTAVFVDVERQDLWVIVKTLKPYDKNKILAVDKGKPIEVTHQGKKYHKIGTTSYYFPGERLLVFGSEKGVKKCLELPKKPKSGPLNDALKLASKSKYQFAAGINVPADLGSRIKKDMPAAFPGAKEWINKYASLLDVKTASMTGAVKEDMAYELILTYADRDKAKKAESTINDLLGFIKTLLPLAKIGLQQQGKGTEAGEMIDQVQKQLEAMKPRQSGNKVTMSWIARGSDMLRTIDNAKKQQPPFKVGGQPKGGNFGGQGGFGGGGLGPVGRVRDAAARSQAQNNFRQIALAFHNYADAHGGRFPPAVITDQQGRPLYSWRVALLPYLEEGNLSKQLKLNEPWNSPHNSQFHNRMPKLFALPYANAPAGRTHIQVFTGANTPFVGNQGSRFPASFTDGTSNTILIAEAMQSVPWMAPQDLAYTGQLSPLFQVGNSSRKGTLVALADGSVRFLSPTISDKTLRAAITPNGGEILGPDW